jgi:WD40 repeat protein
MCELQLRHTIILDLPAAATTVFPWCRPRARNAALSLKRSAQVWDVASGRATPMLRGHTDQVWGVAFAPDGHSLVTGSWDGTARVWGVSVAEIARRREDGPRRK